MSLRLFLMYCGLIWLLCLIDGSASYAVGQSKYGHIEKFPYQVMLIGKQLWRKRILCGGTLLDNRWILTAGHCTMGVTHFDVYLGTKSVDESMEAGKVVLRSNKFIVHERFNPSTAANDIALVKLPEDIVFTSRIKPAALPHAMRNDQFIGSRVVATGWGAAGETTNSDPMQFTELRVISNEECADEFDVVTDGVLCAKGLKDETVCSGDSGGPLVLKGTQMVVGVTSFGPADGCETNIPGGFTRVTHYLDWIDSKIGNSQANYQQQQQQQQPQQQAHQKHQDGRYIHHRTNVREHPNIV
ncbi:brachyurin [Haematobia irritans]|uniref:brachyurin n=1 Tax=Haematobia irritans TaxID=7368 RepID=UPI003F507373